MSTKIVIKFRRTRTIVEEATYEVEGADPTVVATLANPKQMDTWAKHNAVYMVDRWVKPSVQPPERVELLSATIGSRVVI